MANFDYGRDLRTAVAMLVITVGAAVATASTVVVAVIAGASLEGIIARALLSVASAILVGISITCVLAIVARK